MRIGSSSKSARHQNDFGRQALTGTSQFILLENILQAVVWKKIDLNAKPSRLSLLAPCGPVFGDEFEVRP